MFVFPRFLSGSNCNRNLLETAHPSVSEQVEALKNAEVDASRSATTELISKPASSNSWWNMSLWSKGSDGSLDTTQSTERNTKS